MIEIEKEKDRIMIDLDLIEKQIRDVSSNANNQIKKESKIKIIDSICKFQRDVEYIFYQIDYLQTPKTQVIMKRISENIKNLEHLINSEETFVYGGKAGWNTGLLAKVSHLWEEGSGYANRELDINNCLWVIGNIRSVALLNFFADIQLVNRLMSIPVEEKKRIIEKLKSVNLQEVITALSAAEDNIISDSIKDAIDRCREALEKTVASIVVKKGGNVEKFGWNLQFLFKPGNVIDEPTKDDVQGFYSHLAELTIHGKSFQETLDVETKYVLGETYNKIMKLLEISEKTIK